MKIVFTCILSLFIFSIVSFGYEIEPDMSYEELYSKLEDLNYEYECLLEEYHSEKRSYEELAIELKQKEEELQEVKEENKNINGNYKKDMGLLLILGIAVFLIGCMRKDKNNKD